MKNLIAIISFVAITSCAGPEMDTEVARGIDYPDTTCGLPTQCAPWSCDSDTGICYANSDLDVVCQIACGQDNAYCPPVGASNPCHQCDGLPANGDLWRACYAGCMNATRTTCQLGIER
jgi:hypothetical protein